MIGDHPPSVGMAAELSARTDVSESQFLADVDKIHGKALFGESAFQTMLALERRRAQRSGQFFILMLLDARQRNGSSKKILQRAIAVVASCVRETDLIGWYQQDAVIGIIFTQVTAGTPAVAAILQRKVATAINGLGDESGKEIAVSAHVFPEDWDKSDSGWVADPKLYSDLGRHLPRKRVSLAVKRAMDIVGSAVLLVVLAPVLATIALLIWLTSREPALFAQERLGQFAARFKFFKFRTMHTNCDHEIHEDYVEQFIAGTVAEQQNDSSVGTVYKITNDPRVTVIGRFLRRSSLDELPQLWNVLRGDMSLVGPRPPVPYEFEMYDVWQRRRVLEVKPGITGLWQVHGRSRTRFVDMVRLDLRYSQSWSLWMDIKILLATPWAVISGTGAH
jgi:lipopolysaccharide/colanic/teichoic acid biosynthesis glycosyltransferase